MEKIMVLDNTENNLNPRFGERSLLSNTIPSDFNSPDKNLSENYPLEFCQMPALMPTELDSLQTIDGQGGILPLFLSYNDDNDEDDMSDDENFDDMDDDFDDDFDDDEDFEDEDEDYEEEDEDYDYEEDVDYDDFDE